MAGWLRDELAPRPGRFALALRIAVNCAVTVIVANVFEIPLPAYMAYIVFLISREEYIGTTITAVGGLVAATAEWRSRSSSSPSMRANRRCAFR